MKRATPNPATMRIAKLMALATVFCSVMALSVGSAAADSRGSTRVEGPGRLNVVVLDVSGQGPNVTQMTALFEVLDIPKMYCGIQFKVIGREANGTPEGRHLETTSPTVCGLLPRYTWAEMNKNFAPNTDVCAQVYWFGKWREGWACVRIEP